jgi:hypothetical protein
MMEKTVAASFSQSALALLDPSILDAEGAVLYSAATTLRQGRFYFLGLNPAGAGEEARPVKDALVSLELQNLNAYDEIWDKKYGPCGGGHPLQRNAKALFKSLGTDIANVCASNLIFTSSKKGKDSGGWARAEQCWPMHELLIHQIVRPEAIIAYGKLPFDFIRKKLSLTEGERRPADHGNWVCRSASGPGAPRLIGLPHLSVYALRYHDDVMNWIKEKVTQ